MTPLAAQPSTAEIDEAFASFDNTRSPGCAVGITRAGQFLFERGYGMANLEYGVPLTSRSVFRIASVSKQFTAASVAILAERGELDLDADIRAYLTDLNEYSETVTVRQMIHHLSGMGDYNGFEVRPGEPFRFGDEDYWTTQQFYDAVKVKPLAQKPLQGFRYSNLAYFLLAQLVEKVSGQSLRDFAQAEIFEPVGMKETFYYDDVREIVPNRALGHTAHEDGSVTIGMTNLDWVGDGGVHTTLADMALWDQALAEGKLPGGKAFVAKLHTPYVVDENQPGTGVEAETGYAYGVNIDRTDEGETVIQHSGGWVGFNTYYGRFVDRDFGLTVLCNRNDGMAFGRYDKVVQAAREYVSALDQAAAKPSQ
ncbi:MAG: serine hydrolase domain-containing protein [Pseudomonadota bacterium]